MYTVCQKCGKKLTDPEVCEEDMDRIAGRRLVAFPRQILANQGTKPIFPGK